MAKNDPSVHLVDNMEGREMEDVMGIKQIPFRK